MRQKADGCIATISFTLSTTTPHFVNLAGGIPLVFVQYLRACIWLIGMSELSRGDANSLELVT